MIEVGVVVLVLKAVVQVVVERVGLIPYTATLGYDTQPYSGLATTLSIPDQLA